MMEKRKNVAVDERENDDEDDGEEVQQEEEESSKGQTILRRSRRLREEKPERSSLRKKRRKNRKKKNEEEYEEERKTIHQSLRHHQTSHSDQHSLYALEGITAFLEDCAEVDCDFIFQNPFTMLNPSTRTFESDPLNTILPISGQNPSFLCEEYHWRMREKRDLLNVMSSLQSQAILPPYYTTALARQQEEEEGEEEDRVEEIQTIVEEGEDVRRAGRLFGINEAVLSLHRAASKRLKETNQRPVQYAWPVLRNPNLSSSNHVALNKLVHNQRSLQCLEPQDQLLQPPEGDIRSFRYDTSFTVNPQSPLRRDLGWVSNDVVIPSKKYVDYPFRNPLPLLREIYSSQLSHFQQYLGERARQRFLRQMTFSNLNDSDRKQVLLSSVRLRSFDAIIHPPPLHTIESQQTRLMEAENEQTREILRQKILENAVLRHLEANIDAIIQMIIKYLLPYVQLHHGNPDPSSAILEMMDIFTPASSTARRKENGANNPRKRSSAAVANENTSLQSTSSVTSIRSIKRMKVDGKALLNWENILFLFQSIADELVEKNQQSVEVKEHLPIVLMTPALVERVQQRVMQAYMNE